MREFMKATATMMLIAVVMMTAGCTKPEDPNNPNNGGNGGDHNLPIVSTSEVENVGTTTASCGGNVTDEGGAEVTERGICWGTNHRPVATGSHATSGSGSGVFTCNMNNLDANTTYYVRAYAKNIKGVAYGEVKTFTTMDFNLPEVTTAEVTNITQTAAKGGGEVTSDGGTTVTERGICWSTNHNPTVSGSHANSGTGADEFTINMTSLTPNTTYYVRAYAINSHGTAYGEEANFKTSQTPTYTIGVSANPLSSGTVTGSGTYEQGQSCTVCATAATGHIFQKWTESGIQVSTNANYTFTVTDNRSLVAHFRAQPPAPTGAINGLFSVSASQRVYFSQGNLQYQASTNTWRFAEKQYYTIGENNCNISSTYSGWIDLFGWGTSGYNNKYPYNTSTNYNAYGNGNNHIAGTYYDWGVYNSISNGGNQAGMWRTLTRAEWLFLLTTRYTSSGVRFAKAQVNGVNGVILIPDDWSVTTYSLNNTNEPGASFTSNVVGEMVWQNTFEPAGVVFLPAAGDRNGTSVYGVGSYGRYWSASCYSSYYAYSVIFNDIVLLPEHYDGGNRYVGRSVRLVCPAE